MSVEVTIEGLEKFMPLVDDVRFLGEMDQAVMRSARELTSATQRMPPVSASTTGYGAKGIPVAPKYGGSLRQGIQPRKVTLLAADIVTGGNGSKYGGYVHDGTSKMQARPFFKWLLEDFGGEAIINTILQSSLERFTRTS